MSTGSKASGAEGPGASAIERKKRVWSSRRLSAGSMKHLRLDCTGALGLRTEHPELGNPLVPFDQRRHRSAVADCQAVEVPYPSAHVPLVRVEQVRPLVGVAGEMYLADPLGGQRRHVVPGAEAVVSRAHVHI